METFRYIVAVLLTSFVPAVLLYWLLLHPLIGFWRKLGLRGTEAFLWIIILLVAGGLFSRRHEILAVDLGFQPVLFTAGMVCLAGALIFRLHIERFMSWRVQLGLPEIAPGHYAQDLITEGPFAHSRNPRYLQVLLALLGWSLMANYAAAYLASALWIPALWVIIRWEEQELRRRFGVAYEDYCQRVPRFWPQVVAPNGRERA